MIKGNAGKYNSEDGRIRVCIDGKCNSEDGRIIMCIDGQIGTT